MAKIVGGPHRGHAAGDTDVEKAASQLVSDTKYKVKQRMGERISRLSPAAVAKAYLAQLEKSPATPAVKAIAKKKLLGKMVKEEYGIDEFASSTVASAMYKVFVDGVKTVAEPQLTEEENPDERFLVVVTDKATGNEYRRKATRAKIAELRANPNIARVEITQYGKPYQKEAEKGEQTAAVKSGKGLAKRDYDGDGNVESGAKEYRGAVHNAIQKRRGLPADGKDTSSVKEELVGKQKNIDVAEPYGKLTGADFKKLRDKKNKVMESFFEQKSATKDQNSNEIVSNEEKGVNNKGIIKVFPEQGLKETAHQKFLKILQEKAESEQQQKLFGLALSVKRGQTPRSEVSAEVLKIVDTMSEKKIRDFAKTKHEGIPNKVQKEAKECEPELKKMEDEIDDPRQMKTKINLAKNKLRAMGLKMSYEPEGEDIQEIPLVVAAPLVAGGIGLAANAIGKGMKKFVDTHSNTKSSDYTNQQGLGASFAKQRERLNAVKEERGDEPGERDDNPDVRAHNRALRDKKGRRMYPSGRAGYGRRPDISKDPRYGSVN